MWYHPAPLRHDQPRRKMQPTRKTTTWIMESCWLHHSGWANKINEIQCNINRLWLPSITPRYGWCKMSLDKHDDKSVHMCPTDEAWVVNIWTSKTKKAKRCNSRKHDCEWDANPMECTRRMEKEISPTESREYICVPRCCSTEGFPLVTAWIAMRMHDVVVMVYKHDFRTWVTQYADSPCGGCEESPLLTKFDAVKN